ncbi:antibiotic biosynthesis monooxygenase [Fibrella sp. HMF5335]|uniref:Antibiotic biosynthesis monooxygenase n=1 Tax=Fibrella rubiginis TaxID=2817060 RepID=A0A939GBS9_9BACT|nr:antibiotic biosynthesis monooxygenase [Fibrella rubiginis]MBO0935461.1 antibiotic biosynthesis monooxygenase [Fibrella rubiginis]
MITVLFEVTMQPGQRETYLNLAKALVSELEKQDGFISVERFESLTTPDKLLSLQTWRDEASVVAWRNNLFHQKTMPIGYQRLFADYRLRVLNVIRDYGKHDREQAPTDVSSLQAEQA